MPRAAGAALCFYSGSASPVGVGPFSNRIYWRRWLGRVRWAHQWFGDSNMRALVRAMLGR
jgi:hypothetical protein